MFRLMGAKKQSPLQRIAQERKVPVIKRRSLTHLNLNTLHQFRQHCYECLTRAADALFNTADALLTETQAHSFPELSLSPFFERQWPSLYEAFEDGRIDQEKLRAVFASHAPHPQEQGRMWLGIDASRIERPESLTSAD